jgi:hypothetical protein
VQFLKTIKASREMGMARCDINRDMITTGKRQAIG